MSARSVREGKKAIFVVVLVFMPIMAIAVGNAGWIGKAMVQLGMLPADMDPNNAFIEVAKVVCPPGVLGVIIAAVVAALMSTIDTLINAVSAIAVNDIWRRKVRPGREDAYYLKMARYFAIGATGLGILLVPVFRQFDSIFQAFSHFCSIVVPPMIVVITLGALWKRFTPAAAFWTLMIGSLITLVSLFFPLLVTPVAHGVAVDPEALEIDRSFTLIAQWSQGETADPATVPWKTYT
jgi:SSS family solute:Na+ symporter